MDGQGLPTAQPLFHNSQILSQQQANRIRELEDTIRQQADTTKQLADRVGQPKNERNALQTANRSLRQSIKNYESNLRSKNEHIESLRKRDCDIVKLERKYDNLKDVHGQLQDKYRELDTAYKSLASDHGTLRAGKIALQTETDTLKRENETLRSQVQSHATPTLVTTPVTSRGPTVEQHHSFLSSSPVPDRLTRQASSPAEAVFPIQQQSGSTGPPPIRYKALVSVENDGIMAQPRDIEPSQLPDSIQQAVSSAMKGWKGDWVNTAKSSSGCVAQRMASASTTEHPIYKKQVACKTCSNARKPCIRIVTRGREHIPFLLPLPPGVAEGGPDDERYWVRSAEGPRTTPSEIWGGKRKRDSVGSGGNQ